MMSEVSKLTFLLVLSIRTHIGQNRSLSIVTVLVIATSVALAIGLEMASRSVHAELERTAKTLAGAAEIEVSGGDLGIPEQLLEEVSAVPGVLAAAPLIQTTFRLAAGAYVGQPLHVLGVDLLADQQVREFTILKDELQIRDPLRLLAGIDSLIVSRELVKRLELEEGDSLLVRSSEREFRLVVRGILAPGGVADAFGGQVAVMDVYSLQTLLGREGWFDRIDVVPERRVDTAALLTAVAEQVGGTATVRRSASREGFVGRALATIRLVALVLAAIGVIVASVLSYGAMSLSVDRRIPELALLRAAGLESWRVRRLIWTDAFILALLGTILGLGIGFKLSRSFIAVFSGISKHIQNVEIAHSELTWVTVAIGVSVGMIVSFCGSIKPAIRASSRPPLDSLGVSHTLTPPGPLRGKLLLILVGSFLWLAIWLAPTGLPALLHVVLVLGIGLFLLWLVVAPLLLGAIHRSRPWLERTVPGVGRLVGASFFARPNHMRLTATAISGVIAGVTAIMVVVESVAVSIHDWHAGRHQGGVLVTADDPVSTLEREPISPDTLAIIRETRGVRAVLDNFGGYILFRGEEVLLGASSMDVMAEYGRLPVTEGDPEALARALVRGDIAISDGFAHHFGVRVGDRIALSTPKGRRTFRAAGIVRDYGGPGGSLELDLNTFDELWHRNGSTSLYIWTDPPVEEVLEKIRRRVGGRQALFFLYGDELEDYAAKVIDRFIHLLYVVTGLTVFLGGIAVMNLLIGSVMQRRRELALLRVAGATGPQIIGLVLVDGLIVAMAGAVFGVGLGLPCASHMSGILTDAFGWTLVYAVDPYPLVLLVLSVGAVSLLAGIYPALTAKQMLSTEVFAPEWEAPNTLQQATI